MNNLLLSLYAGHKKTNGAAKAVENAASSLAVLVVVSSFGWFIFFLCADGSVIFLLAISGYLLKRNLTIRFQKRYERYGIEYLDRRIGLLSNQKRKTILILCVALCTLPLILIYLKMRGVFPCYLELFL